MVVVRRRNGAVMVVVRRENDGTCGGCQKGEWWDVWLWSEGRMVGCIVLDRRGEMVGCMVEVKKRNGWICGNGQKGGLV